MNVSAIVWPEPCKVELGSVELPDELAPNEFRARTHCSGVSIGTERLLWENRLSYARFPMVVGYQAIGTIEAVGEGIEDLRPGQRVIWRSGRFSGEAAFPVSGCHAAAAVVTRSEATPIPDELDDLQGSLFVMPCVGYHGVDMAGVRYGELVAVQGLGLIGLGVVAAARLRGARVVGIDVSPERRAAALAMGADQVVDPGAEDAVEAVNAIQAGGADVVFEATGFGRLLDAAFALARVKGRFVFQGNYGADAPISYQFIPPHGKQLTAFYPCNDGLQPCRRAVTQLMARGAIDLRPAISHVVKPAAAVDIYRELVDGRGAATNALGVVIDWR
ncbi:MAG: zinc-binding dehydrogenase [Armatimonadetes bacterium]|nr:zinc-binding dehydrogenase [Armatimonadota bacterium]